MAKTVIKKNTINPANYLREVRAELKRVIWPTRRETVKLSLVVIAVSLVVAFYIGALDFVFSSIVKLVIGN